MEEGRRGRSFSNPRSTNIKKAEEGDKRNVDLRVRYVNVRDAQMKLVCDNGSLKQKKDVNASVLEERALKKVCESILQGFAAEQNAERVLKLHVHMGRVRLTQAKTPSVAARDFETLSFQEMRHAFVAGIRSWTELFPSADDGSGGGGGVEERVILRVAFGGVPFSVSFRLVQVEEEGKKEKFLLEDVWKRNSEEDERVAREFILCSAPALQSDVGGADWKMEVSHVKKKVAPPVEGEKVVEDEAKEELKKLAASWSDVEDVEALEKLGTPGQCDVYAMERRKVYKSGPPDEHGVVCHRTIVKSWHYKRGASNSKEVDFVVEHNEKIDEASLKALLNHIWTQTLKLRV